MRGGKYSVEYENDAKDLEKKQRRAERHAPFPLTVIVIQPVKYRQTEINILSISSYKSRKSLNKFTLFQNAQLSLNFLFLPTSKF